MNPRGVQYDGVTPTGIRFLIEAGENIVPRMSLLGQRNCGRLRNLVNRSARSCSEGSSLNLTPMIFAMGDIQSLSWMIEGSLLSLYAPTIMLPLLTSLGPPRKRNRAVVYPLPGIEPLFCAA